MKKIFFVLWMLPCFCFGQTEIFQKVYSLDSDTMDITASMIPTSDGGYILIGNTDYYPKQSPFVLKLNSSGDVMWSKRISFTNGGMISDIQNTFDGNFIISGFRYIDDTSSISVLIKMSNSGSIVFEKEYSLPVNYSLSNFLIKVKQLPDSGFVVTEPVYRNFIWSSHVAVFKTNSIGELQWDILIDSTSKLETLDIEIPESEYGITICEGCEDGFTFLTRLNNNGGIIWSKRHGINGLGWKVLKGSSLNKTSDNKYVLAGYYLEADSLIYQQKILVMKTDSLGNEEWTKKYSGVDSLLWASEIIQTFDGGYIVAATTTQDYTINHPLLLKLDSTGTVEWSKKFNAIKNFHSITSLIQTEDSGFAFSGWVQDNLGHTKIFIVKTDKNGIADCKQINLSISLAPLNTFHTDSLTEIPITFLMTSYLAEIENCSSNVQNACWSDLIPEIDSLINSIIISPNPATTEIKITNLSPTENQISIFNLLGQQVKSIRVSNVQSTIIPVSDLPAGMYVVTIFDGEKIVCKKFVKE